MGLTARRPSNRTVSILVSVVALAALIGMLGTSFVSCATQTRPGETRPLTSEEIKRLADMRMNNFADGRVAIKGTIGRPEALTQLNGWVDWRRALIYLSVSGNGNGGNGGLLQSMPGVIAIRPNPDPNATPPPGTSSTPAGPGQPPLIPPGDGWRLRSLALSTEDKSPLDNLVAFLFVIARDQPDKPELLKPLKTRWVRKDKAGGAVVDVLLGPAVIPVSTPGPEPSPDPSASPVPTPDPSSLEANGGAVGYWVDEKGRLRRVETVLGAGLPAQFDLIRGDQADFVAIDALGGRDIEPRAATSAEASLLSGMRARDLRAGGGAFTITLPVPGGALRTAKGWLDWRNRLAYLAVQDADDPKYDVLMHADRNAVSLRQSGERVPATPPLPAPKGGWERTDWDALNTSPNLTDLDIMLHEAMSLGLDQRDDAQQIAKIARRLRVDVLGGVPVGVFEMPNAVELQYPAGQARMRYWLDNSGVLRRLEVRTAAGGFAQLDLDLSQKVPALPGSVR